MKIRDVMTPCPYQAPATSSLKDILKTMGLRNIRHVPVVDQGQLLGVISERDARLAEIVCETTKYCPNLGEVCFKDPYVVSSDTDLTTVAKEMAEKKYDYALVSDDEGNFLGIFTSTDACRTLHLVLSDQESRG